MTTILFLISAVIVISAAVWCMVVSQNRMTEARATLKHARETYQYALNIIAHLEQPLDFTTWVYSTQVTVVVVYKNDKDDPIYGHIKTFAFDRSDPDSKLFALSQAEELIDKLKEK